MNRESPPQDQYPVRILVVDDHPNTATMLARALSQLGASIQVTSATSGQDALDKVRHTAVDILITDMIMPEMTGLELIEKLQNHPGGKPSYTYLITAYDVPGLKVSSQRLRVNEVILKPVRPERICQIAAQAIEEMNQTKKPLGKSPAPKRRFKILVADDMPDNITLLTRYLENEGYDHISAMDGLEALNKARNELPDMILLDINMPNKDGFAILEEIRANPATAHIPVIILTAARLEPMDVQFGLNLGADDYVTKPFDRRELMARIRAKLRVKEAEDIIRRRNRELSLLPEIGKELSECANTAEIANAALKRVVEALGAMEGHMVLLDEAGNATEWHKVPDSNGGEERGHMDIQRSLLEHITETRQGMIVNDTQSDPIWKMPAAASVRSAAVAPIFGRRGLLGLLFLTHEQENYFSQENLLLLQAIATQSAIAIENARLYENAAWQREQLKRMQNEFFVAVSHDLKNPIAFITQYSDLLTKAGPLNAQQREYVGHIQTSAGNMLERVESMLKLTSADLRQAEERRETMGAAL
ncbi:MAG: response regulator [Anaerolineaceae bacterium]|jgi:CheY-like chemotaxis protein|nr:MAG: response regulator [Anaerolineaceae bacterium]